MRPVKTWMLLAAWVLGALTFAPLPALPDIGLPSWFPRIVDSLPLNGMRVLILEETSPKTPLPHEQSVALRSLAVHAYLDSKTLMDSQGGLGWRKFDPDSSLVNLPKEWQDIRAKLKPELFPWLAIADSSGRIAFEGPYPATEADAVAFLKKYGG